jgi:hypothetical protein
MLALPQSNHATFVLLAREDLRQPLPMDYEDAVIVLDLTPNARPDHTEEHTVEWCGVEWCGVVLCGVVVVVVVV